MIANSLTQTGPTEVIINIPNLLHTVCLEGQSEEIRCVIEILK